MPSALIIEDEPMANELLSTLVRMQGYATCSAYTGREALEQVRKQSPDLVFLDLMLPDTNGYDVCRALKSRRGTNLIPVVMVTARVEEENRLMSYRVGASDYVPKPYTPDQIFTAMRVAHTWRRSIETHADEGQIILRSHSEAQPFAEICGLQSLLLARTSWDEDSVRQLGADLTTMCQRVIEWGQKRRLDELAILRYEIQPIQFTLVVKDLAGWFSATDFAHQEGLGLLIGHDRFDDIRHDARGSAVVLVKRFAI